MELRGYKLLLAKTYFDKGWGLTNQLKYVLILFGFLEGLKTNSAKYTIILAVVYGLGCYILGRLWYKYKFIETENEINNIFNPFQREIRAKLKNKRFK